MTGSELRKARRGALDLTQAELAERIGLSARTIREYELRNAPVPKLVEVAVKGLLANA